MKRVWVQSYDKTEALFVETSSGKTFHIFWTRGECSDANIADGLAHLSEVVRTGTRPSNDCVMRDGKMIAA